MVGDEIVDAHEAHSYCHSHYVLFDIQIIDIFSEALPCNPTFSLALIALIVRRMRSLLAEEMMDRCREALAGRTHLMPLK